MLENYSFKHLITFFMIKYLKLYVRKYVKMAKKVEQK